MEAQIRPEPSREDREAILAAVERLPAGDALPPGYRSAWRAAGVRENLDQDEEPD